MARSKPTTAELLTQAVGSFHAGDLDIASAACFSILQAQPTHLDALLVLAATWHMQGQADASRLMLDFARKAAPGHSEVITMQHALGATAENHPASPPDSAQANLDAGMTHWGKQQHHAALACWHRAVASDPARADLLNCRAQALSLLGNTDAALADFELALQLRPDSAELHNNQGALFHQLGRRDEAAECYRRAIAIRPGYALAYFNLGKARLELGHPDEAMAYYEAATAAAPDYADAHFSIGTSSLLRGDFARGWREYEWRWQSTYRTDAPRDLPQALWLGDADLHDKRILLWAEQGFGDAIQFCRYASQLAGRGALVILEAPATLAPLLKSLAGIAEFTPKGSPLPPFDFHCPLLSLPLALKITPDSVSGQPYLTARFERIDAWRKTLGTPLGPRVGLAWSGNPEHKNDCNRSIPLAKFIQGLVTGIEYIQLQKDVRSDDQSWLEQHPTIRSFDAQVNDFGDTAALIETMDLVVTVDTSIAHLAGALGKEVWILLAFVPDWRWLLDRSDSPWYDSARLFRQPTPGDWDSVLVAVRLALAERFALQPGDTPSRPSHHQP